MSVRLLVMADTHGYLDAARRAIVERGPWDHLLHLGDSVLDAVDLAAELGVDVVAVRGNNEYEGADDPGDVLTFEAGGVRFYAVHGHQVDLNPWDEGYEDALKKLAALAIDDQASVALFGHTHVALVKEIDGVLLVNPGGLGLGDRKRTYAAVTVDDQGVVSAVIEDADD